MTSTLPISDDELPALFAGLEAMPLALAVSGGADSMALMHMIARWAAREDVRAAWGAARSRFFQPRQASDGWWPVIDWHGIAPPQWIAAHKTVEDLRNFAQPPQIVILVVDHGLRPESAEEAAFVAREAAQLGFPCEVLRWEGDKPSTGIQDAAREARRRRMVDCIRAESGLLAELSNAAVPELRLADFRRTLIMAHHQEDQAETFLMRLARGSGLEGLGGMRNVDLVFSDGNVEGGQPFSTELRRPLLAVPKARLVSTLEAIGAKWVEDLSNQDERFERVRIRRLLAQLEQTGVTADAISLSARRLSDARYGLLVMSDGGGRRLLQEAASAGLYAEIELCTDVWHRWFAGAYNSARTLRQVLRTYGGTAREPELAQLESLASLVSDSRARRVFSGITLGGCKIELQGEDGDTLRIYREGGGEDLPVVPLDAGQVVDWDGGRFTIEAGGSAPPGATVRALGPRDWADLKRAVKGLGDLGWPAAAVATVPVIEWGGGIIAYPVIDQAVRALPDEKRQIKERWTAFTAGLRQADYCASFRPRRW